MNKSHQYKKKVIQRANGLTSHGPQPTLSMDAAKKSYPILAAGV